MVAAPGLLVGVEHLFRRAADRRLPRDAVPALIADDQVGTIFTKGALIELRGDIDALDGAGPVLRVTERGQALGDLVAEAVGCTGRVDDALRVLVLDIYIDSSQPDREI